MGKDDPKKYRVDRRFLSGQPHEIAYVRRKLARENPGRDPADIDRMIHAVRVLVSPSESRARFMLVCRFALNPPTPPTLRKRRPTARRGRRRRGNFHLTDADRAAPPALTPRP